MSGELTPEAREILRAGRDAGRPSPVERERVRAAVMAAVAAGPAPVGSTPATPGPAPAPASRALPASSVLPASSALPVSSASLTWKTLGLTALLGFGAILWWQASNSTRRGVQASRAPTTLVRRQPAAVAAAPLEPTLQASAVEPPAAVAPAPPEPSSRAPEVELPAAVAAAPAPATRSVRRPARASVPRHRVAPAAHAPGEAELIAAAHRALQVGDVEQASLRLREHERRFPHGLLEQEREVELILVTCRRGLAGEARERASRFEERWPRSPHRARIGRSCVGPAVRQTVSDESTHERTTP